MQSHDSLSNMQSNTSIQFDHPLSPRGRFNRISYIGWCELLNVIFYFIIIILSISFGIFNVNQVTLYSHDLFVFSSIASFGYLFLSLLYLYFNFCFVIRRLHDTNKSGWFCLFLFVPILNIFLILYLLFARGCSKANRFGHPRRSRFLETVCAWLIIIMTLITIFTTAQLISDLRQANEPTTPTTIIQKGTEYF